MVVTVSLVVGLRMAFGIHVAFEDCNRALALGGSVLPGRRCMNGERVNAAGEFPRQGFVDHAVTLEPGLTFEGVRYDIDPEMGLPARPVSGVARVLMGFINHVEALRLESPGQLLCDEIGGSHAARLKDGQRAGQWPLGGGIAAVRNCQVLNLSSAKAHSVRS
jgi:hypothetical protein